MWVFKGSFVHSVAAPVVSHERPAVLNTAVGLHDNDWIPGGGNDREWWTVSSQGRADPPESLHTYPGYAGLGEGAMLLHESKTKDSDLRPPRQKHLE